MDLTEPTEKPGPSPATGLVDRLIESRSSLDPISDRLLPMAAAMRGRGAWRNIVTGQFLGHAAHPALTDLPIGFWTSATALDLLGGEQARKPARRLVGLGLASAPLAVVTGWAEWAALEPRPRRVGLVHANLNTVAAGLYAASWAVRPRRHRTGVALSLLGAVVSGTAAYLGGHLAIGEKVGTGAHSVIRTPVA